jgi:hypothetical protein
MDPRETRDLRILPLGEEPVCDAALNENLDGPCVQTACARAPEVLGGATLDNDNINARQGQFACQRQPRRTASGDCHRMLGYTHLSLRKIWLGWRFYRMTGALKQVPCALHMRMGGRGNLAHRLVWWELMSKICRT